MDDARHASDPKAIIWRKVRRAIHIHHQGDDEIPEEVHWRQMAGQPKHGYLVWGIWKIRRACRMEQIGCYQLCQGHWTRRHRMPV